MNLWVAVLHALVLDYRSIDTSRHRPADKFIYSSDPAIRRDFNFVCMAASLKPGRVRQQLWPERHA